MFTIGDTGASLPVEGKSDVDPIFLEGEQQVVSDLFLDHIYGWQVSYIYYHVDYFLTELYSSCNKDSDDTYTREQLQHMLQFTDKYHCPMM